MLLDNRRLRNKYDPDVSYAKANAYAEKYNKAEAQQWWESPCTQELVHRLEGDIAGCLLLLMSGGTLSSDVEATAQNTHRHSGQMQTAIDVLELIDSIKRLESRETDEESEDNRA